MSDSTAVSRFQGEMIPSNPSDRPGRELRTTWFLALMVACAVVGVAFGWSMLLTASVLGGLLMFWLFARYPILHAYLLTILLFQFNIGFVFNDPYRITNDFVPLNELAVAVAALILLFRWRTISAMPRCGIRYGGAILFFSILCLIYAAVSLCWSADRFHGTHEVMRILEGLVILVFLPFAIRTRRQAFGLLLLVFFLAFFQAWELILSNTYYDWRKFYSVAHGCKFEMWLVTFGEGSKLRLGGFAPVDMAANMMNFMIFVDVLIAARCRWLWRIPITMHGLLMTICLLKTGSKGGAGALIIGLCAIPFVIPELRSRILRLLSASVVATSALIVLFGDVLMKRINIMTSGKTGFLSDRLEWWGKGFVALDESFGLGQGAGGFPILIDPVPYAHGLYWATLFDFGIYGFTLFLLLAIAILWNMLDAFLRMTEGPLRFSAGCLLCFILCLLIHSLIDFDYGYILMWFVFGFIMALQRMNAHEQQTTKNGRACA